MSSPVIDEAKRIAAEFEFPAADVNRAVKEYIEEMKEGLARQDSSLSQIPSYITSVPDGSEKVGRHLIFNPFRAIGWFTDFILC